MTEFNFHSTAEDVTEGLDLTGQNGLLQDATPGLGLETIRVLAMRGAHIVAEERKKTKCSSRTQY